MEKYFEEEWRRKWFDTMLWLRNNIQQNPMWGLSLERISENPNATMEFIFANPHHTWNWNYVSSNINVTLDIVRKHPEKQWNWRRLTQNPSITFTQMKNNPNLPWAICETQIHGEMYETYLEKIPRKRMSPYGNRHLVLSSVEKFPDLPCWDWHHISWQPDLSLKFVTTYAHKFANLVDDVCQNEFEFDKHYYILYYMKYMHILTIYETHMENCKTIDCSNLSSIEYILFDEFLVSNLLKY